MNCGFLSRQFAIRSISTQSINASHSTIVLITSVFFLALLRIIDLHPPALAFIVCSIADAILYRLRYMNLWFSLCVPLSTTVYLAFEFECILWIQSFTSRFRAVHSTALSDHEFFTTSSSDRRLR